jgi:hypothetical protein
MGTLGSIVAMSFLASIGILLLVLGCALPEFKTQQGSWYAMFNLFFYILAPIPVLIMRRMGSDMSDFGGTSNLCVEVSLFFTAGIVVSAFGLPIVLARAGIIKMGAMGLVVTGNFFIFLTIFLFFAYVVGESDDPF